MAQENQALTATLNRLAELNHYNHWAFERISHGLGRQALEVGSGTGAITQCLSSLRRCAIRSRRVGSRRCLRRRAGFFTASSAAQARTFDRPAVRPVVDRDRSKNDKQL